MDRDWSYFAFVALGIGLLWLLHRRRAADRGTGRRGLVPVVAAILAIVVLLALTVPR